MGPLDGLRVVEIAGFGPAPMAGMLLADYGAAVTRIERPAGHEAGFAVDDRFFVHGRGKTQLTLDLKQAGDLARLLALLDEADVVIEGFRPGVAERIGFGPAVACARNPRLVYARVTAWGQSGPWAQTPAHDINVVAATGTLAAMARPGERPPVPLNLVADFGGGGLYAVTGILAALHERSRTGRGQVIDAAMAEGALSLMCSTYGYTAAGIHRPGERGNLLNGDLPWYGLYPTSDGWIAVGALEPQFFVALLDTLGIPRGDWLARRDDPAVHDELRGLIGEAFAHATRAEWAERFAGIEACVTPVATMDEVADNPHFAGRGSVTRRMGFVEPGVAPRFQDAA